MDQRSTFRRSVLVALLALAICYWASPYLSAIRFAEAAAAGNVEDVLHRIDAKRLKASFARQIVRAYASTDSGFQSLPTEARQGVSLVAAAYVEAMLSEHLTPGAVAMALSGISSPDIRTIELPRIGDWGAAWQIFNASGFTGPVNFVVDVPSVELGQVRLVFRFLGTGWRLASVTLPQPTVRQLIDRLRTQIEQTPDHSKSST